ncbi:hypothetical protein [Sinomonas humi]|uniref:Potassium transporter Trk n=1 Tax=Sinomonas humi TaxID=1338436 RepID=A0A0B2AU03_9MICC|nr:hypothetical protein [Sinomonas humi]KHL05370.1 hypothetical protein LK10_01100 [Sinomonas humi]
MPSQRQITVRRAPKFVPFLVTGGLLGAIAAVIFGSGGDLPDGYTSQSAFGYFLVLFVAVGVLVGGVAVLIVDRVSIKRARRATVEELPDEADDEGATS